MNVASVALCKELFKLGGWVDTYLAYHKDSQGDWGEPIHSEVYERYLIDAVKVLRGEKEGLTYKKDMVLPAYDFGYLLRKLPRSVTEFWGRAYPASPCLMFSGTQWVMFYQSEMSGEHNTDELFGQFADTPENAACMLAIELFKQGILKREEGENHL